MNRRLVDTVERIALTLTLIGGVLLIVFYWQ
jgi:hypothetical protein